MTESPIYDQLLEELGIIQWPIGENREEKYQLVSAYPEDIPTTQLAIVSLATDAALLYAATIGDNDTTSGTVNTTAPSISSRQSEERRRRRLVLNGLYGKMQNVVNPMFSQPRGAHK